MIKKYLLPFFLVLCFSQIAYAHHPFTNQSLGHVKPKTFLSVDVERGMLGDSSYNLLSLGGSLEVVPGRLSVEVSLPFSSSLDGSGDLTSESDIDAALKLLLLDTASGLSLSAGVGLVMPLELVNGSHLELTPFLSASQLITNHLMLHGTVLLNKEVMESNGSSDAHHNTDTHDTHHSSLLDQHESTELGSHVGLMFIAAKWLVLNSVLSVNLPLNNMDDPVLSTSPEVELLLNNGYRLGIQYHLPLTNDNKRFDSKLRVRVKAMF